MIVILLLAFLVMGWMLLNPEGRFAQGFLHVVTRSKFDQEARTWPERIAPWLLMIAALGTIALLITNMTYVLDQ